MKEKKAKFILQITPKWRITTGAHNIIAQKFGNKDKDGNKLDPKDDNNWKNQGYWSVISNGGKDCGYSLAASFIVDKLVSQLDNRKTREVETLLDSIQKIHDLIAGTGVAEITNNINHIHAKVKQAYDGVVK